MTPRSSAAVELRGGNMLASPEDFDIPVCVDTAEEVIAAISEPYRKWLES